MQDAFLTELEFPFPRHGEFHDVMFAKGGDLELRFRNGIKPQVPAYWMLGRPFASPRTLAGHTAQGTLQDLGHSLRPEGLPHLLVHGRCPSVCLGGEVGCGWDKRALCSPEGLA